MALPADLPIKVRGAAFDGATGTPGPRGRPASRNDTYGRTTMGLFATKTAVELAAAPEQVLPGDELRARVSVGAPDKKARAASCRRPVRVPGVSRGAKEAGEPHVAGLRCAQAPTKIAGAQAAAPGKGAVP